MPPEAEPLHYREAGRGVKLVFELRVRGPEVEVAVPLRHRHRDGRLDQLLAQPLAAALEVDADANPARRAATWRADKAGRAEPQVRRA